MQRMFRSPVARLFIASLLTALLFAGLAVPSLWADAAEDSSLPQPQSPQDEAPFSTSYDIPAALPDTVVEPEPEPASCPDSDCCHDYECEQACPGASSAFCTIENFCVYGTGSSGGGGGGGGGGGSCDMDCSSSQDCVSECGSQFFCNSMGSCQS